MNEHNIKRYNLNEQKKLTSCQMLYVIAHSKIWLLFACLLSIWRILLTYNLPISALSTSIHDDALMADMAVKLLSGNWLGEYSQFTMPKGIVYPLYLVFVHKSGISYLLITQLLYMLGAFLSVLAIHKKENGFVLDFLIYGILIFNPLMSSLNVYTRIYRNVLVPIEVLFVFAGILGMFMRLEQKNSKLIFWAFLSGAGVLTLNMTREDSIWIMPFLIVASIVFLVMVIIKRPKGYPVKVCLIALPFLMLILGNQTVKTINHNYYGILACTDTNATHFTDAIKAMYSVEDAEDIPMVSVSRQKMEKLYANSPTLASVRENVDASLDAWADAEDNNVTDAHFFWAVRDGLAMAGLYRDAVETDEFYHKIANELNTAMDEGRLEKRTVMPSALMSPWRKGYFGRLMDAYGLSYRFVSSFYSCETVVTESVDNGKGGIRLFEDLTNDKAVYPGQTPDVDEKIIKKQDFLNNVYGLYSRVNQIVLACSLILFAGFTLALIFRKSFRDANWKLWLSALGALLSAFVLVSGVAYTHISAYPAISASYLAGVYPLMLLFEGMILYMLHGVICDNVFCWKTNVDNALSVIDMDIKR